MENLNPRKRGRKPNASIGTAPKVGMESDIYTSEKAKLVDNFYKRRQLLAVPSEILDKNPDKHFYWERVDKLQKSGGWHERGYQLYRRGSQNIEIDNPFGAATDDLVHRNEMVLMWMPKQEYKLMELEREVAEGKRNIGDVIRLKAELSGFSASSKVETNFVQKSEA